MTIARKIKQKIIDKMAIRIHDISHNILRLSVLRQSNWTRVCICMRWWALSLSISSILNIFFPLHFGITFPWYYEIDTVEYTHFSGEGNCDNIRKWITKNLIPVNTNFNWARVHRSMAIYCRFFFLLKLHFNDNIYRVRDGVLCVYMCVCLPHRQPQGHRFRYMHTFPINLIVRPTLALTSDIDYRLSKVMWSEMHCSK